MNKEELKKNLIALGINSMSYTLNGPPYNDSSWVLKQRGWLRKKWNVFKFERGKRYNEKSFITENEACEFFYEKLEKEREILNKYKFKHW